MKRILSAVVLLGLLTAFVPVHAWAEGTSSLSLSAQSAILLETSSGQIIYEKNAYARLPMASTTKIMTALVALEKCPPDGAERYAITVDKRACGVEGSSIYLVPGERLTLEALLYAMMLESANDAAAAIAIGISGSIEAFADEMNALARTLGLADTHFTNPHGLDGEEHYTTAADLARLTAYALENETFRKIVSTESYTIPSSDGSGLRYLKNHNKLLRLSDTVIGVKTGFTKRSGRCLVSAAEQNGVTVVAVTLNAPDDWNDHLVLHKLGFSAFSLRTLAEPGEFQIEIPCTGAADGKLTVANREGLRLTLRSDAKITRSLECRPLQFPPISEGDCLAKLVFYADGEKVGDLPLYATQSVMPPQNNKGFFEKIKDLLPFS